MYPCLSIEDAQFGGYDSSSSGASSPVSSRSGPSESDGSSSSNADEFCPDPYPSETDSPSSSSFVRDGMDRTNLLTEASACVLDDIDRHRQRMLALLPAFSSPAGAGARAESLSRWLSGFCVGWVLDMDASGSRGGAERLPRREVGRRVRAWAQAMGTMERVFRLRHRELTVKQVEALGELAAASAGAMLRLARAVAALESSPSKLLAALDVYVPVSEAFPVLGRMFSWGPSHPVSAAAGGTLAALVDAARSCGRDLRAFVRSHYPWRMPQGGEVHPCVGFWMGYFRCMLRNRISLCIVLGGSGDGYGEDAPPPLAPGAEGGFGLVTELVSCLEAVIEEKSTALAFPGLRQVFMLNNTFAIVRRAVRSDLKLFLPPGWVRAREERMAGYIKGYMDASWAPVVARLDDAGGTKPSAVLCRRTTNRLSAFYSALENACSAQRCWKVPNPVLRGILRKTVSATVVPAYRRHLEVHPEVDIAVGRSAEELEQQLSDLFEG
ncbi:exocyst complex component EXO70A1-like [Panicum miliaceum]|uniref:Exocyst subunit Exo70 family protein n=1 Tax=Panicum miliaceum TaxID=4540 RepID=A0A3L6PEU0_PANMI|nr:exocyst complex component EXO70A1-like [Panicum miliaceum]